MAPKAVAHQYDAAMVDSGIRLSDLLVSLSMATDLGFGQPPEHMARSARIGMRLGDRLGLDAKDLATLYDVGILTYVGCPVYGNESAMLFGDDIDFRAHAIEVDLAGFSAMMFMLRRAGHGTSAFNRARQADYYERKTYGQGGSKKLRKNRFCGQQSAQGMPQENFDPEAARKRFVTMKSRYRTAKKKQQPGDLRFVAEIAGRVVTGPTAVPVNRVAAHVESEESNCPF